MRTTVLFNVQAQCLLIWFVLCSFQIPILPLFLNRRKRQRLLQESQDEKHSPQHSMQISRQSADSQHASMMPQSMSQGRSQSPHSSDAQQQQKHESSDAQEPHVAQSSIMLQSVRNSQNRQARMQWTQQSFWASVGICELLDLELPLLLLLLWLLMDGLDCSFFGFFWAEDEDEDEDAAREKVPFLTPLLWGLLTFLSSDADPYELASVGCMGVDRAWGWYVMLLPWGLVRSGWDKLLLLLPFSNSSVFSISALVFVICSLDSSSSGHGVVEASSGWLSSCAPSGGLGGLWLCSSSDICSAARCQVTKNYPANGYLVPVCRFSNTCFNPQTYNSPVERWKVSFSSCIFSSFFVYITVDTRCFSYKSRSYLDSSSSSSSWNYFRLLEPQKKKTTAFF